LVTTVAIREQESATPADTEVSSYLQYLPAIYRDDIFLGRFLCIMENILKPIEGTIDNIAGYFDPYLTPEGFLPWLASWVGLTQDESWPLERRREMVRHAAELYRWRSTRRGLSDHLRIYAGVSPIIQDNIAPNTFAVTLLVEDPATVDETIVRAIIEAHRPAHTTYRLEIGRAA
jgi:phage tail-like protein